MSEENELPEEEVIEEPETPEALTAIQTVCPDTIVEPDNPYDKLLINLNVTGVRKNDHRSIAASVTLQGHKYRVLQDGTIEFSSGEPIRVIIGDAFTEAGTDADLATAMNMIFYALQVYIAAKGL